MPKKGWAQTPEMIQRLRRIRAMIERGCEPKDVVERYGGSVDYARELMREARELERKELVNDL